MKAVEQHLWHGVSITLGADINFTGTKPFKASFNGKEFKFNRRQGWKKLYETIVVELYNINPKSLRELAKWQIEFFISDEPAHWCLPPKKPAETYTGDWWSEIANGVYVYNKNSTSKKIENLRKLFDVCGIDYEELEINLY